MEKTPTKRIIVFGKTGAGKTTMLMHLAGEGSPFKPSDRLQSDTATVTSWNTRLSDEYDAELIDTIGFYDNRNLNILDE
jgi:GTPase SAR1 family protein